MTVSLFLILLTFFILLNSIAVIDEKRTRVAIGSLLGAFGGLPGGLSPFKTGDSIMPLSAPMVTEIMDVSQLMGIMGKKMELGELITINSEEDKVIIAVNEKVLFHENTLELKPSSYPFLNKLRNYIVKGEYPLEIAGHTDSTPAREKGYKTDWELSTLMAIQVMKYLISDGGIPPARIAAYGCGSRRPIASNATRQSRAQNRRIDIILNYKASAYIKRIHKKSSGYFTFRKFDFKLSE